MNQKKPGARSRPGPRTQRRLQRKATEAVCPNVSTARDVDAALVRKHLPLVMSIAYEMSHEFPGGVELQEVVSVGTVGLVSAIDSFDGSEESEFRAFAEAQIRHTLTEEFISKRSPEETPPDGLEEEVPAGEGDQELEEIGNVNLEGRRILIVEDSGMTRMKIRVLLKKQGFEVFEAKSGEEAVWLAQECSPDLILMDVVMDGMDGFETCHRLKQLKGFKDVPVIFLTGKGSTADVVRGFDAGGSDYILKPFDIRESLSRIRAHLNVRVLSEYRQKAIGELRRVNVAKDKLLRMASHDLRNPLTAISGLSEMMLEDFSGGSDLSEEQKEMLEGISSAAESMAGLLNDLLEFSRAEEAESRCDKAPTMISEIAQQVITLQRVPASRKGIGLMLEKEDAIPEPVEVDRQQIRRVLENFISNAIKFSPSGTTISVLLEARDQAIRVNVMDEGPGIPEGERHKLFKEFSKLSNRPTGGESSTGLGLSICKRLIENHGGTVGAYNREDGGACFFFELPPQ